MLKAIAGKVQKVFEQPVNRAFDKVAGLFANNDQLSQEDKALMALIKAVLPTEPEAMERDLARFRSYLERHSASERRIEFMLDFLRKGTPGSPESALPILKQYTPERQKEVITHLLALAFDRDDFRSDSFALIRDLALKLDIAEEEFESIAGKVKQAQTSRLRIIKSGTGIILALIVITVFVLIATWLSSVLFGLALAFIFLPLEQFFERHLHSEPGKISRGLKKINVFSLLRKKFDKREEPELDAEEIQRRKAQALTTKATTLTVSTVVFGGLVLLLGLMVLTNYYFTSLRRDFAAMRERVQTVNTVQAENAKTAEIAADDDLWGDLAPKQSGSEATIANTSREKEHFFTDISKSMVGMLENLKKRFESLPVVHQIIGKLADYLADGEAEEQLTGMLLKRSGGILGFVADFVAAFASFLLNLLLTFFFFSLFLNKIANFSNTRKDHDTQASSYIIRTVFNGKWLPQMSDETLQDGDRILGEVIRKLRIWLRGYMTLIAIDFCVYTTIFMLLDVPYAVLLGAVAGVGIILPYIGPISSALLTVLVTFAVGGADVSVLQILGIIGAYLIHNGIVEQFFTYPMIIGESLGLTTLETIIVVLLGGIIAGIPGMIFALPAASVIKYLVPQIYHCWR